jgi:hypothetical protein
MDGLDPGPSSTSVMKSSASSASTSLWPETRRRSPTRGGRCGSGRAGRAPAFGVEGQRLAVLGDQPAVGAQDAELDGGHLGGPTWGARRARLAPGDLHGRRPGGPRCRSSPFEAPFEAGAVGRLAARRDLEVEWTSWPERAAWWRRPGQITTSAFTCVSAWAKTRGLRAMSEKAVALPMDVR